MTQQPRLNFKFYLLGKTVKEQNYYLDCDDGTRLRLKKAPPLLISSPTLWQVLPHIDSDGQIKTVTIETQADQGQANFCSLVGRIIQRGKREPTILIKVDFPRQKPFKLTLVGANDEMKVGQLWQIRARREGTILKLIGATIITSEKADYSQQVRVTQITAQTLTSDSEECISSNQSLESQRTNQQDNNQVNWASFAQTSNFSLTLTGRLEFNQGNYYLLTTEGTSFLLKKMPPIVSEEPKTWQVIPSTSSDGTIANITILTVEEEITASDKCYLVGTITQLGTSADVVLIRIARPNQKPLRITLVEPFPWMKVGQNLEIVATREGKFLKIETAFLPGTQTIPSLDETNADSKNKSSSVNPNEVLAALSTQTGINSWQIQKEKKRPDGWEWEAVSNLTQSTARVQIKDSGATQVYQYSATASESSICAEDVEDNNHNHSERLSVRPLGAARSIGASCFQVHIGPYEVVLDCGTRFSLEKPLPALEYLENPNLLLISHAHQDHLGGVPVFHQRYPACRMICTTGTREIAHVMLTDGLKIQQLNEDSPQLFDSIDLEQTLWRLETMPVGIDFEPLPGLTVRFINAGHILGAACIYLQYGSRSLLYTGDFNHTNSRTTTGMKLADLPQAEILITESTYGDNIHPSRKTQETELIEAVVDVVSRGGNVLIPAFALGRAQEILLALRTSARFQQLKVPVYVDGLVRAVTNVFEENLDLLPSSVRNFREQCQRQPFFDLKSSPPIIPISSNSQRPVAMAHKSVIVASSGMLVGGPSVYYARVLLERENAAIFICGYTDEESPGRQLQNLQTGDLIELDEQKISVAASVKRFYLSAHADKVGLGQIIKQVNPKHLVLIHGSVDGLHSLARAGNYQSSSYVHIPAEGEVIELGVPPKHLNPTQVASLKISSEVTLHVESMGDQTYLLKVDSSAQQDPRFWPLFGTGRLQGVWKGSSLTLTALKSTNEHSPTETQETPSETLDNSHPNLDSCGLCQFLVQSCCTHPDSPLFELKVDPQGICSQFQLKNN